jgi:hypothetical protein
VLAAAQQRSSRSRTEKPPVYFYIDECQNVIARDEKIPTILDECRSQNIALIMAHQRTKQITSENVLDALSNCAIRFANSDEEARYLAPRLRTSPEFLQSLGRGKFAAFVRDLTPQAIAVSVSRVDFGEQAMLTSAEGKVLTDRMRAQYGTADQIAPASPPAGEVQPTGAGNAETASAPILPSATKDEPNPSPPKKPRPGTPQSAPDAADNKSEGSTSWS